MKTIKPQKLGVMSRVFENGREFYFVITVMVFFPLDPPTVLLSEQALPITEDKFIVRVL